MNWYFAKNDGGQRNGFHDPGVETFKGNFDRYLAREVIQNSLDARPPKSKQPVLVTFDIEAVESKQIPGIDSLSDTLGRCADFWRHEPKAKEFFHNAQKMARSKSITCLFIRDFATTGVVGGDNEPKGNWFNLIRSSGSSSKGGGEGGSFGIGKNAPFAASLIRTVLYSTYNIDKEHAFQGIAKLVSHKQKDGSEAQATGYLGGKKGASIRKKAEIPVIFRRDEPGTDIVVLGFRADTTWQDDLLFSVLENFWPAIEFGHLEVRVGETDLKKKNLKALLNKFSSAKNFAAHRYHEAYVASTKTFEKSLPALRTVSVHLLGGDTELPKHVAMVRKTGMVIYHKRFGGALPFCGVFLCRNDVGNQVLREMEPPRHDIWDPHHPDKNAHKKTEEEFMSFVRECIKNLSPGDQSKVISLPDLGRFLPDDEDTEEQEFEADVEAEKRGQETFEKKPAIQNIEAKSIDRSKRPKQPDSQKPGDEDLTTDEETEEEGLASAGGGGGTGEGGGEGGGQGGTGEEPGTSLKERPGATGGMQSKPAIPVNYRVFAIDNSASAYRLTIKSQKSKTSDAYLVVCAIGDDAKVPAPVKSAALSSGECLPIAATGVIGPINLTKNSTLVIDIELVEPLRASMEIAAHEIE
jgi:hypothetical protein